MSNNETEHLHPSNSLISAVVAATLYMALVIAVVELYGMWSWYAGLTNVFLMSPATAILFQGIIVMFVVWIQTGNGSNSD